MSAKKFHLELMFFAAKKLRDQASRVEKTGLSWRHKREFIKIKTIVTLLIMTLVNKIPI